MAGPAFALSHWLMERSFTGRFFKRGMTAEADHRYRLPHLDTRDQTMGKVAGLAVILLDRLVDDTALIFGRLVRMTLSAGALNLRLAFDSRLPAPRDKDQNSQADET